MKLVTGVSTDLDFVKQVNEHGADLTIGSTPNKLLESLELDESLNITYNSDNETIVNSVNREESGSELVPDLTLNMSSATVSGEEDKIMYTIEGDYSDNPIYVQYSNEFKRESSFNGHVIEITLPNNETVIGSTRNDGDVLGSIFICNPKQHNKPFGVLMFSSDYREEYDEEQDDYRYYEVPITQLYLTNEYESLTTDYFLSLRSFDVELGSTSNTYTKSVSDITSLSTLDLVNNIDSLNGKTMSVWDPCYGFEYNGVIRDKSLYIIKNVYEWDEQIEDEVLVGTEEIPTPIVLSVSGGKLNVEVPKSIMNYDYYISANHVPGVYSSEDNAYVVDNSNLDKQFLKAYLKSVENQDDNFANSNLCFYIDDIENIVNPTITEDGFTFQGRGVESTFDFTFKVDSSSGTTRYLFTWNWNDIEDEGEGE